MTDSDPLGHPRVTLPKNLSESLKRLENANLRCSRVRLPPRRNDVV
jgi:hypothetical protein